MKLTFLGGARSTTGSMHLLEANGARVLLDCGLFQGRRKEAFERNRHFAIAPGSIDCVLLSHAHIDHSGNLPTLAKGGFKGPIVSTKATFDLCDIMLRDSASLQVRDVEYVNKKRQAQRKRPFEPLYTPEDISPTMTLFKTVDYGESHPLAPGITMQYHDAGHILGSALTTLEIRENGRVMRLFFTGDMGRKGMPILKDPALVGPADALITESTYGDRLHDGADDVDDELCDIVNAIKRSGGKLIIPAFSVGRTQQILYFLSHLCAEGRIPTMSVFVDSPLSTKATSVYKMHPECYDRETTEHLLSGEHPFSFNGLNYITEVEESKRLNRREGPAIIISASGMCEGGRILHHLKHGVGDERNIILFVGYQAEHTLGRKLVEHARSARIFGETHEVRASIRVINALSAHADWRELLGYFESMERMPERAFVVHGEPDQAEPFAERLRRAGVADVVIPNSGAAFEV